MARFPRVVTFFFFSTLSDTDNSFLRTGALPPTRIVLFHTASAVESERFRYSSSLSPEHPLPSLPGGGGGGEQETQSFITLDFYRERFLSLGRWTSLVSRSMLYLLATCSACFRSSVWRNRARARYYRPLRILARTDVVAKSKNPVTLDPWKVPLYFPKILPFKYIPRINLLKIIIKWYLKFQRCSK